MAASRCYCPYCREEFKKRFGKDLAEGTPDEWREWIDEGMAEMVKAIHGAIKSVNKNLIVSAYCLCPPQFRGGQRGERWANEGYLDICGISSYWYDTAMRIGGLGNQIAKLKDKTKIASVFGTGFRFFGNPMCYVSRPADILSAEIEMARKLGVKHILLFKYGSLIGEFQGEYRASHIEAGRLQDIDYHEGTLLDGLREGVFKEKAIPYFREKGLY